MSVIFRTGDRILRKYEIITFPDGKLYREGFYGRVYLARDTSETRRTKNVIIKELKPEHLVNERARKRFHQESRALMSINHPNVVRVFWSGIEQDKDLMVMEYMKGGSLRDLLKTRGNKLSPEEAVNITCSILKGLAAIHSKGIIHRDLKPENVLISDRAVPKVSDLLPRAINR